jgi:hypothetical protein
MPWTSDYRFPEPLHDLRSAADVDYGNAALEKELSPGHVLYGTAWRVIAVAPFDELIVEAEDDAVFLVTLTWSGEPQAPPGPETETLESAAQLESMIKSRWGRIAAPPQDRR